LALFVVMVLVVDNRRKHPAVTIHTCKPYLSIMTKLI